MTAVTVIVAILAFLLGAASRSCNCCNRYGHVWRKPIEDDDASAICDRCGEYPDDHGVIA